MKVSKSGLLIEKDDVKKNLKMKSEDADFLFEKESKKNIKGSINFTVTSCINNKLIFGI